MTGSLLQTAGSDLGFVGEFLTEFGIPPTLASAIGSAAVFFVVSAGLILGGRLVVVPVVDGLLEGRGVDPHARKPVRFLALGAVVLLAVGLGFALAGYGNVLLALSTVAAAATLAVGLAMQDVIKNFVAGAFIYTDRPFRTGDWIEWEENSGYVEDISLRVTRVRTFDNEHLTVPNSQLTDDVIKNYDRNGTLRLRFVFQTDFRDDVDEATELILDAARATEGVLDDPAPSVKFTEINESSFGLQSRIWIRDPGGSDFLGIRGEFVKRVTERFERAGIEIPYPHRTVEGSLDVPGAGEADFASGD